MKTILFCAILILMAMTSVAQATSVPGESEFVPIKGGTFAMGSPESENWRGDDETQHQVTLSDFSMARREVTQAEYQALMGENPSNFKGDRAQASLLPVENVTWLDAVRFCNARSEAEGLTPAYAVDGSRVTWDRGTDGYRLPTEAEWEYACRAGTATPFNTETSISAEEANYYGHYPYEIEENYFNQGKLTTKPGVYRGTTVEVGSFKPNRLGLYDMHGNVAEWCWDVYGPYGEGPQTDPAGPAEGTRRVNRGGGWNDFAKNLRSAYRAATPQENRSFNLGIRLARGAVGAGTVTSIAQQGTAAGGSKILVAYFSWSGNTQGIAREIQRQTGADLFEIEPEKPYSSDYNTVLREAQRDQRVQARPKLKGQVKDISQYDVIFLGFPVWWYVAPTIINTFLEAYDLSGKTIILFATSGGSGFGKTVENLKPSAPGAAIREGKLLNGRPSVAELKKWVDGLGV